MTEAVAWMYRAGPYLLKYGKDLPPLVRLSVERWPLPTQKHWTETPLYPAEALAAKDAQIAELEAFQRMAIKKVCDLAREAGEAKGRLEGSEIPGIVDGWREKCERLTDDNKFFSDSVMDFHRVCNANRAGEEIIITGEVTAAFNRLYGHVANRCRQALKEKNDVA